MTDTVKTGEFPADLLVEMRAQAPLNLVKAQALADDWDVKVRSIIAKATREGIAYEKAVRVGKTGKPVASKDALVAVIAAALDIQNESLSGLTGASKTALQALRDAVVTMRRAAE